MSPTVSSSIGSFSQQYIKSYSFAPQQIDCHGKCCKF
ncbi:hypothetical protein Gogos_022083 [Gossypium gossypioides]|uniref:Uncharacterized protein n=1 Tax=Gossypium gossypioides TaxID=34282 RepID=A0A7J9CY75_GOSGO|nr:hypothetical protein [Gossypium gossypioides]